LEHVDAMDAPAARGAVDAPATGAAVDARVVARALMLLDEGSVADARELLKTALDGTRRPRAEGTFSPTAGDPFEPLGDAELESAFEEARPETDSMIDADGIAFEAIRRAKLDAPENLSLAGPDSPFRTRTMADLLECQGDVEGARAIRLALDEEPLAFETPAVSAAREDAHTRTIQTLERWLARLRGGES